MTFLFPPFLIGGECKDRDHRHRLESEMDLTLVWERSVSSPDKGCDSLNSGISPPAFCSFAAVFDSDTNQNRDRAEPRHTHKATQEPEAIKCHLMDLPSNIQMSPPTLILTRRLIPTQRLKGSASSSP